MRLPALALSLFVVTAFFSSAQETKPAPKTAYVPVKDARAPNPVKPTPESIAEGKKTYGYDCAQCHGATGDGKTHVAKELKVPNLTDPAFLKDWTDGELFYTIKNGHGNMPPEGNRVTPEQLWNLVNYIRSLALARKQPPAEPKPSN
jgi:mono/diheme cytochrome c family protein